MRTNQELSCMLIDAATHSPALARHAEDACNACALVCAGPIPAIVNTNLTYFEARAHLCNLAQCVGQIAACMQCAEDLLSMNACTTPLHFVVCALQLRSDCDEHTGLCTNARLMNAALFVNSLLGLNRQQGVQAATCSLEPCQQLSRRSSSFWTSPATA